MTPRTDTDPARTPVIVDGLRTPFGRYGGALAGVRPDDLAAHVLRELVARTGIDPPPIDDVLLGAANQAGEDNRNVARMAALLAGLPISVPGQTVNRLCGSGLQAVASAAHAIRGGDGSVFLAGGVESMTRAPFVMAKPSAAFPARRADDVRHHARLALHESAAGGRVLPVQHGRDRRERGRAPCGVSREEQDAFAVTSQRRWGAAQAAGRFDAEIVPIEAPGREARRDADRQPRTSIRAPTPPSRTWRA